MQATSFLPKEFEAYWLKNNYEVLRYTKIDKVTYTPSPWVRLEGDPVCETPVANPVLMPDYGNKANYLLGETVTISVFDGAYTAVELSVNGEGKVLAVPEDGQLCICPDRVGYYQAVAVGDGRRSEPVEFCVVNASVTTDKKIYREQEPIKPTFSCAADDKLVGWVIKTSAFAKYWGYPHDEDGTVPESGQVPKGSYMIIALYRNNFGVYSSLPSEVFEVVAEEAAR